MIAGVTLQLSSSTSYNHAHHFFCVCFKISVLEKEKIQIKTDVRDEKMKYKSLFYKAQKQDLTMFCLRLWEEKSLKNTYIDQKIQQNGAHTSCGTWAVKGYKWKIRRKRNKVNKNLKYKLHECKPNKPIMLKVEMDDTWCQLTRIYIVQC